MRNTGRSGRVSARGSRWHPLETLESRQLLALITWDGGGDGTTLSQAANWTGDVTPGASDDALVDIAGTPTLVHSTGTFSVLSLTLAENLNLTGGTITVAQASSSSAAFNQSGSSTLGGAGNFTFSGAMTWTGGTMSGTGKTIITSSGTLTLSGGSLRLFRNLDNAGAAAMTSGTLGGLSGPAYIFTNQAGATFNLSAGTLDNNSTNGLLINEGSISVTTGGSVTFSGCALNNNGTVTVNAGILLLSVGGTNTSAMTVAASGTLRFNGTWTHTAPSSVTGAGAVGVLGGACAFQGTFTPTGAVAFTGGTASVAGGFSPSSLTVNGGSPTLNGDVTTPTFAVSSGTLGGTGDVTVTSAATWSGGTLAGTGPVTIASGVTLTITGGSPRLQRTIDNSGTINWTSGNIGASSGTSGIINNLPGAVFNATASALYDGSTPSQFNNSAGAVLNVSPAGACTFDSVVVTNAGTINVTSGTWVLNGGGSNTGTISVSAPATMDMGGTWTHAASASVDGDGAVLFDGTVTFTGSYTATGAVTFKSGTTTIGNVFTPAAVTINGGAATLNADVTVGTLTLSSGTLSGSGEFTITTTLAWSGGTMSGTGKTVLEASGTGTITNTTHTLQRAFDNEGAIDWTAGAIAGSGGAASVFTNFAGATFHASAATSWSGSATPGQFINHGTFTRSGGGTTTFSATSFTTDGALSVAGGALSLSAGGSLAGDVGVASGASLNLAGNASHAPSGGAYTGDGTILFDSGTHTFGAGASFAPAVVLDGATLAGAVALTFGGGLTWNSGTIATDAAAVPAGEALLMETTSSKILDAILNVGGTTTWSAGSITFHDGRINNLAGGVFNAGSTGSLLAGSGVNLFSNAGTFNKITSATTTLSVRFNNTGTLAVQAGFLVLSDIGTNSGPRSVAAGATLRFNKGYTHNAGSSITGAGTVEFLVGTHTFAATTSFGPGVVINGSGTILNGAGTLTFTRTLSWLAGTITGAGQMLISPTCLATFDGGTLHLQRAMFNNGTVNWVDGAIVLNAATITNSVGRPFNATAVGSISAAAGTTGFINKGTFNKTTANAVTISVPFTQQGVLNVTGGTLTVSGGGSATAARNIGAAGVLRFTAGYTHGAGANLNGSGFVDFAGGAQNVPAALAIAAQLRFSAGSVVGAGAVNITGASVWTGGSFSGTGAVVIGATGKLTLSGTATKFLGKNLTNNGTLIWTGGNISMTGSTLTNSAGKTFTASAAAQVLVGGGANVFRNLGTFTKTGTTATTFAAFNGGPGVQFNNTGTVNVNGGSLVLASGVAQVSGFTLTAGKWNVAANTTLNMVGATIRVLGAAANVSLAGLNSVFAAISTLNNNQGTLTIFGGRTLAVTPNGGTFVNRGVLFVRKGSALAVTGKFVQLNLPTASLRIEIAGTTPGTMGRVTATTNATLAGNLTISYLAFTPTAGQLFAFLTSATRTGTFTTTTLPPLTGLASSIQYLATGARLRVV